VFRNAIAAKALVFMGLEVDPEREITVTCGSTEAMIATLLAVVNPGDEVIIFEPFYENYGPDAILSGAIPRFVPLRPPDWNFDPEELERAFNSRTKELSSARQTILRAKFSAGRNWKRLPTFVSMGRRHNR
jgi:aminotransferase